MCIEVKDMMYNNSYHLKYVWDDMSFAENSHQ